MIFNRTASMPNYGFTGSFSFYKNYATIQKMKKITLCCAFAAGIALSGCVTDKSNSTVGTVGPAPTETRLTGLANGTLLVYSAYKRNADFNSSDPNRPEHSDYKILNADGSLLIK